MGGERTLRAFYFCYFAAIGVTEPFLPVFFRDRGLSLAAIGGLLALLPAIQATVPFAFTVWAEARGIARGLFRTAAAGTVVAFLAFALPAPAWTLAAVMAAYAAIKSPLIPFANAMAFSLLGAGRERFGRLRVFGSLGYIVAAVAVGFALEAAGAGVVLLGGGLALLAAAGVAAAGRLPEPTLKGVRLREAWGDLLRNRALCWFLAATFLVRLSGGTHLTFFTLYLREAGIGEAVAGVAWAVGVAAEVAVMLAWPLLLRRFPLRGLLALGFGATAVRWAAVTLTGNPAGLVLIQTLHGLTFGVTYLASVHLMDTEAPPALRASGQALYAAVAFGLAGLLGNGFAGLLAERVALTTLFRLSSLVALLGTALFFATSRPVAAVPAPASSLSRR
ncbi:MAG: MFS transporter [candidate division NC10 bacterium]|nr:MFS transporter [candidate division NC10 bacterium]